MVRIQLLGPVRAWRDGAELDLGGPKQQAVLALLAAGAAAGNTTSPAELVDALWPENPPATAENVVQTYLKHLRRRLEPDRPPRARGQLLRRVAGGYTLDLSEVDIDVVDFRQLVAAALEADRAGDPHRAAAHLREALRLWHGTPPDEIAAGLSGERWAAVARYGEALLATGEAAEAVPVLVEAATAYPLDEAAQARLIRAYHAAGDRAQALATYQAVRQRLAEELGVDPGHELTAAHDALLAEDHRPTEPPGSVVPAQLPPVTAMFTGRLAQLRQLDQLLSGREDAGGVTIAIVGAAGVGKTALAVRWARQVAERFPDGQLFVNLRGFDPARSAMDPSEAIRGFLEALDVPPQRIPASLDARVGQYRSLIADRRMLVVLDNARDAAQVRPLLPGSSGALAVVTSRDQLAGLVTVEGGVPLRLGLLTRAEAAELLSRRIGADRVAGEPEALTEIIRRCAGLPLALAIVAARAAARPEFGLATLAGELRQASTGLDPFAGGDPSSDLRAVLSWSYRALTPAAARLFRLLALHPGPEMSTAAAASLAGVAVAEVRSPLSELTRAHLLDEPAPGRFAFHDLLRDYATELTDTVDSADARAAAAHRMLDHYVHTAHAAAGLLDPHAEPVSRDPAGRGVTPEHLTDGQQAQAWFAAERHAVVEAVHQAATAGLDRHTWLLAWASKFFLSRYGYYHDWVSTQQAAIQAAKRLHDPGLEARAHRSLAGAYEQLGRYDDADLHLRRSLELLGEPGDRLAVAHTHLAYSALRWSQRRRGDGLRHAQHALDLFEAVGTPAWQARALNAVGWYHAELGDFQQGIIACQQAIRLQQQIGDHHSEGLTWDSLGYAHHRNGDHEQAITCFRRALKLLQDAGDRYSEAEALAHLGDANQALDRLDEARTAWRASLAILSELGHPEADDVRQKLQRP